MGSELCRFCLCPTCTKGLEGVVLGKLLHIYSMNKPNHNFSEKAEVTSSASAKRKENANPPPPPALPPSAVLKMGRQEKCWEERAVGCPILLP